jgi:cation diffusion facilitator family transporter
MSDSVSIGIANKEKSNAALTSVIAAIALTVFKVIVGTMTGSLGILAEAAHSGLDLVAALVTFVAVRFSGRPADDKHHYGHGKIENLSALFETLLLLATSLWIIYEAFQRLFVTKVEVEISVWAFAVMTISIIIDFTRSRVLYKAARKYNSQALEADALHFSTDIWSSSVVIIGLIGVAISKYVPALKWMHQADAVAAIGVAIIVIYVSFQLGKRTIEVLLDTVPNGLNEKIKTLISEMPGVLNCHNLRIRNAGPEYFIDAHILADPKLDLTKVHQLTEDIETAIRQILPGADVTIHAEPKEKEEKMVKPRSSKKTKVIPTAKE